MKKKSGINNKPSVIGMLVWCTVVVSLPPLVMGGEITSSDVFDSRSALEEWVQTRRIISQEKQNFNLAREMFSERIELVEREIKSLRDKIKKSEDSITDLDKKRVELIEKNEKFKQLSASLEGMVTGVENRTNRLLKKLPRILSERVKPLSQRFAENPKEKNISLGQRFQNVVGVLNEVNKFNRDITVTSEVRELSDGTSVEVTSLYVGIGQGYYVNNNGDIAGIGTSSFEEWVWEPVNDDAAQIAEAIAILKNEKVASFVQLPLGIK